MLGMQIAVICDAVSIWCWRCGVAKEVCAKQLAFARQKEVEFSFVYFSTGIQYKT
jgi:hypothetical protein